MTGAVQTPLKRLELSGGHVALLCVLLLIANNFVLRPIAEFSINPAALLLIILVGVYAGKRLDTLQILQAFVGALFAGLLMLALSRMHAAGRVTLPEPGLFLGVCALPFVLLLRRAPAAALFCASLAPLMLSLLEAALDLYAFGYTILAFGSPLSFDAQIAGVLLAGMLLSLKAPASVQSDAS